ncbi:MAG: Chemotaxis regulatory protein CheY [uncultured bacterium]|nr:MAG: Chemotaxis regulatory protein CheY [uncultured bacterium]
MKILVVDDSSTMRRIIKNTLSKLGYNDVDEAEDGQEALNKMGGVELLVTDWNMPNMDGLTLVKSVRSNPIYKAVPIIMVTTEAAKTEIIEAIKSGVNNYVVKPFTQDILKEKIEQVLNK